MSEESRKQTFPVQPFMHVRLLVCHLYRSMYSTANDPQPKMFLRPQMIPRWTANDPRPQVIPKVDRKWFRENVRNGMDFMGLITKKDWLHKRNLFLSPSKEKGKEDATTQVNSYKACMNWPEL